MNAEDRETFAQLLDALAAKAMPIEPASGAWPPTRGDELAVQLAMQLNHYAFRVRNGDVDPDDVTGVILGYRRAVIV